MQGRSKAQEQHEAQHMTAAALITVFSNGGCSTAVFWSCASKKKRDKSRSHDLEVLSEDNKVIGLRRVRLQLVVLGDE